jgi:hypothetical protein
LNNFSIIIIISSITIAGLFLGTVMVNIGVKNSKIELEKKNEDIVNLKQNIKRQKIEITALTNPYLVMDYIDKKGLRPVSLKKKTIIYIEK